MEIGLSLGINSLRSVYQASFVVTITGLTGGEARPGDHASISYTTTPVIATETVKWSDSINPADPATYGTGASPTDYTAGDGGRLYLHVTDLGETVTVSAPIRYAEAVNTVLPVITAGPNIGDAVTLSQGTWTGAVGGAFTEVLLKDGTPVSNPYTRTDLDSGAVFTGSVTYTNSGGAVTASAAPVTASTYTILRDISPSISGSAQEGTDLTSNEADTYTYGGAVATVTGREYMLLVGGPVVDGPQASPTVSIPAGTAGDSFLMMVRVTISEGGGLTSGWFPIAGGTVAPEADITPPEITQFGVAQDFQDEQINVSITVSDDPSKPIRFDMVGVATGAAAPNAEQIKLGDDAADADAPAYLTWSINTAGSTLQTIAPLTSGTYDFYVVAADDAGNTSTVASALGVSFTAPASTEYIITGEPGGIRIVRSTDFTITPTPSGLELS